MEPSLQDVMNMLIDVRSELKELKCITKLWLNVHEAAEYCNVSPCTIRLWATAGWIKKQGGKKHSYNRYDLDKAMQLSDKSSTLHFSKTLKGKKAA